MHALSASLLSLLLLAPVADGWLGVYLSAEHDEPVIGEVIPDSPAWSAGMKVGDVLLAVGDTTTATRDEFIAAIRAGKAGDRLSIKLRRDGKEQTVVVKLGERPEQTAPEGGAQPGKPAKPGKPRGSEPKGGKPPQPAVEPAPGSKPLTAVKPKTPAYLGLAVSETAGGVVIDRVLADSPAKAVGVEPGDIMTSLGDQLVKELGDLDRFLSTAKPGQKVALGLRNGAGTRSVTLILGERPAALSGDVPVADVEVVKPAPKQAKGAEQAPAPSTQPRPRGETKPAPDLEAELAALRAELAKLRQELEELRKGKGRE